MYIREDLSPDECKVHLQRRREKNSSNSPVTSPAHHSGSDPNVITGSNSGAGDQASPESSN